LNENIIELELPQILQDTKIVTDFIFEINTKNFVLELNHVYNDTKIIFHYNKNWTIIKRDLRKEAEAKDVQEQHIKLLLNALDSNYNTVTMTQEDYSSDIEEKQKNEEKETTTVSNDKKHQNKEENKAYTINKYSQGIPLAESTLINNIPYFIQIIDGKPIYKHKIELSDIDIVPPERTEYLTKEYNFKSEEEINHFIEQAKNEALDSIFRKLKSILKKYIDLDDDFINILAADIIFTYFQDKLGMTHYLLIVGDNNTGKSNILLVFSFLGYRPVLDISITPANIYNFGSQLEEGQCIILEDEIGDIDDQFDKKKMYQASYRTGIKVTRIYDNNNHNHSRSDNTKRKSSRQQGFYLFCFKMFASEKMPDKVKSKGFLERVISLKAVPGDPEYDISEVIDGTGDEQFKELYQELEDTRKLLLMYRLLNYNETIPDVKLNIKNRYKQLTKPLIRLFQNTESVNDIIKSLSKYLIEKNQEKIDSMDSAILTFIVNLVSKYGEILYNDQIWNELKTKYPNGEIAEKPYSWYLEGYGSISKNSITKICETKFGAKPYRDSEKGRGLIFNQKILNKLIVNYSIIEGIKIIKEEREEKEKEKKEDSQLQNPNDTYDTYDTSTECIEQNNQYNSLGDSTNTLDLTSNDKKKIQENHDSKLKTDENNVKKINIHSREVSYLSYPSPQSQDSLITLKSSQHSIFSKIKTGLFINPLISESDLLLDINYDYDPEIINNIDRFTGTDRWFCKKCSMRDDKWFMMKHHCKNNKNN
jgi:hypothetical protein